MGRREKPRKLIPAAAALLTTLALGVSAADLGDGGPALSASLDHPQGLATDASGALYIADSHHHRIRKVDLTGVITTVAGSGVAGFSGDGSQATAASLHNPQDVAVAGAGSLYIADADNNRIRKVDASSGEITTVAGNGAGGYGGDGGPATQASLFGPNDVALDAEGNLYVADTYNNLIRRVDTQGTITTVAGRPSTIPAEPLLPSGDGIPATLARLHSPYGITIGPDGDLYVSDTYGHRIRKVELGLPVPIVTTIAGTGGYGPSGDGGPALEASVLAPMELGFDTMGSLYFAEFQGHRVTKVDPSGFVTRVAGTDVTGYSGDGGPALWAAVGSPLGLAVSGDRIFVGQPYAGRVRVIHASGTIARYAGA